MSVRACVSGFVLSLVLLVSACSKDELAKSTIAEADKLTDDIVKTVSAAEDKRAGVAEAQAKLDAAKLELGPKMEEVLELRGYQVSAETKSELEAQLMDMTMKMISLQADLMLASVSDPELQAALAKLAADHEALTLGE
jgi:hypothetical protein